ncbi:MAG: hypothetical protein ABIY90_09520, partial [Puia sp.]
MFKHSKYSIIVILSVLIMVFVYGCKSENDSKYSEWTTYLGDNSRSHYSSLNQIDTSNVQRLK